jgi:hypothetical protein
MAAAPPSAGDAHRAAFDATASALRDSVAASVFALEAHRGTPATTTIEKHLEHSLDRLAALYGVGTFENLSVQELFDSAIRAELHLAFETARLANTTPHLHQAAARELVDAARRGSHLVVQANPVIDPQRGVYVESRRPEFMQMLTATRNPYAAWHDGIITILPEQMLAHLRATRDSVDVLFLDGDEMHDLFGRQDFTALDAELRRRLAVARAAADRIGDSRERHVLRQLMHQSTILRNLQDRLASDHPSAHRALLPIIADNRARIDAAHLRTPPGKAVLADPLAATIAHEQTLQAALTRVLASGTDPAGLAARFRAVAAAGTHLAALTQLKP